MMDASAENSSSSVRCIPGNSTQLYYCEDVMSAKVMSRVSWFIHFQSLPLNAWVLWLTALARGGLKAFDIFTFTLTFVEVIFALTIPLAVISLYFPSRSLTYILAICYGIGSIARPLCQCCICVERYLAVLYPVLFLKTRTQKFMKYKVMCVGVICLLALGVCGVILYLFPEYPINIFSGIFLVVLAVEAFCCFSILRALRRPVPGDGGRESVNIAKRQSFNTVLFLLVMMFIKYLPFSCLFLLQGSLCHDRICIFLGVAYFLNVCCSVILPLHFLLRAGKLPRPGSPCRYLQKTG